MLVHDLPGFHRNDGFRVWWLVAENTIRAFGVLVFPSLFDQILCLPQTVEVLPFSSSSLNLALQLSQYPFSQGDPGSI